jgi:hypothetical protein
MAKTVDELRNEIRAASGRFEREISASFTKEDLAALCETLGCEIETEPLPSKPRMRADILRATEELETASADQLDRSFRKQELQAIAEQLGRETTGHDTRPP